MTNDKGIDDMPIFGVPKVVEKTTTTPDPSELTTLQLRHELGSLRVEMLSTIRGDREVLEARLNAIDRATEVFEDNLTRIPTQTDREVGHLRDLIEADIKLVHRQIIERDDNLNKLAINKRIELDNTFISIEKLYDEKFASIQTQFVERDTRVEQTARDTRVAVDAALQAAKEAVGEQNKSFSSSIAKSEAATAKQLDQLQTFISTTNLASDGKITDTKDRITRLEGGQIGRSGASHDIWGYIFGATGVGVALIVSLVNFFSAHSAITVR